MHRDSEVLALIFIIGRVGKKINGRATVGRAAGGATGRLGSVVTTVSRQASVNIGPARDRSGRVFHGRPLCPPESSQSIAGRVLTRC